MHPGRNRAWLVHPDGTALPIRPGGLLLGRGADCDLVTAHPNASTVHALVRPGPDGAELVPLGRNPTWVDDGRVDRRTVLLDGQRVRVPGLDVLVRLDPSAPPPVAWTIATSSGCTFGVRTSPLRLGGGPQDDVVCPDWPAAAVTLHLARGRVVLEAGADGVVARGRPVPRGELESLDAGDVVAIAGVGRELRLQGGPTGDAPATVSDAGGLPVGVDLEVLPAGGQLELRWDDGDRSRLALSEQRLALLATLLAPPRGFSAGDWIPDEVLAGALWPGRDDRGRTDVNLALHRARKDLLAAGVDGKTLLERSPAGGATRFAVAPGAAVRVR